MPIPRRLWAAVGVSLLGLGVFTADPSGASSDSYGDACCVAAAGCYAAYDLRLFEWGRRVTPLRLITNKVAAQALASVGLVALLGASESRDFFAAASPAELFVIVPLVLWSGVVVNGVVPFLQVGGQQAIGPSRAQIIYASGPLWAAILSFVALGETVGPQGVAGGAAFLAAVFVAATTPQAEAQQEQQP